MNISNQDLVEKYLQNIDVKKGKTKKLFAIGFVGLNGAGKSFVAEKLSKELGLYIASNDKIRRFLNEEGFEGASPAQKLVQNIAENSTRFLFENKSSHILDADLIEFHHIAKKNADAYSAALYIVHLVCPEKLILKRLKDRNLEVKNSSSSNLSRVGAERYFERKEMHSKLPMPKIFFTIDTSNDVDIQIESLVDKLNGEKVL